MRGESEARMPLVSVELADGAIVEVTAETAIVLVDSCRARPHRWGPEDFDAVMAADAARKSRERELLDCNEVVRPVRDLHEAAALLNGNRGWGRPWR
jgi:hypothetical protein